MSNVVYDGGGSQKASFGKKHSCGLGFLLLFDAVDEADAGNKPAQQVVTVEGLVLKSGAFPDASKTAWPRRSSRSADSEM